MAMSASRSVNLRIEWSQLLKISIFVIVVLLFWQLGTLILLTVLGLMIGVALMPVLRFMESKRIPRTIAIGIITVALVGLVTAFFVFLFPPIVEQLTELVRRLPELRQTFMGYLSDNSGLRRVLAESLPKEATTAVAPDLIPKVLFGISWALGGLFELFLCLVFAIYFLIDGSRTYEWLTAFMSVENRRKMDETSSEVGKVVSAYVGGQALTSLICAGYTYAVLLLLKVPLALVLAAFAGVFDILPIVGFFLFAVPAVLMAFTVSPNTAYIVAGAFIFYHGFENYLLVPKIYGNRMRVSGLVVLLAVSAGAIIAHIQGAIAVLPIVASYPFVERIWLAPYLNSRSITKHKQLENS